jgi:hypothetical protein
MSSSTPKPISDLVRQGWTIEHYSAALGPYGAIEHCFHLTRSGARKVVAVRAKMLGSGCEATELEI